MKNKEKYDLSKLDLKVYYDVDGCGRKIEGHRYVTVKEEGRVILDRHRTRKMPYEFLLEWLEREYVSTH